MLRRYVTGPAEGGLGDRRQLHAEGRIARLEPWSDGLWWFEATDDPFQPRTHHVDDLAARLASIISPRSNRP